MKTAQLLLEWQGQHVQLLGQFLQAPGDAADFLLAVAFLPVTSGVVALTAVSPLGRCCWITGKTLN